MASSSSLLIACFITAALVIFSSSASATEDITWFPSAPACQGSIAECMTEDTEFDMDTEINRRILATTRYISYAALQRNSVPCSRRGSSYYNCRPGAQANPYSRGCSAITRCRS